MKVLLSALAIATCSLAWGLPQARDLADEVDAARLRSTAEELASAPSRMTGTPGCDSAAELIRRRMAEAGIDEIFEITYTSVVPIDKGASLELPDGRTVELLCLWPNNVRTPTTGPEGITGKLVAPKSARPRDLDGLDLDGAIVVLPFDCGSEWINAPMLGARAVIFLEPEDARYAEAKLKFLSMPLDCPRLWAPRAAHEQLLAAASSGAVATLRAKMDWEERPAKDIVGVVRGSDPILSQRWVIVTSHFDSISVVPALAPGAESAVGAAAFLELAGVIAKYPPKRSVAFLAASGHYQGFEGAREFIRRIKMGVGALENRSDEYARFAGKFEDFPTQATIYQRRQENYRFVEEHRMPVIEQVDFVFDIDISSATDRVVGLYKSGFYPDAAGREAVREAFVVGRMSASVRHLAELARQVAADLDMPSDSFCDGVNPVKGRRWRGFVIPDYAAAIEPFQIASAAGLTFTTVADPHLRADTPHDTIDHIKWPNVLRQTRLLAALIPTFLHDFTPPRPASPNHSADVNWSNLIVHTVVFDPAESYLPDTPLPGVLVIHRESDPTRCGVRGFFIEKSDEHACAQFYGVHMSDTEAYVSDPQTGDIVMARDYGVQGEKNSGKRMWIGGEESQYSLLVFRARATTLFDTVDPRFLRSLKDMEGFDIFDAATDSAPFEYGFSRQQEYTWKTQVTPLLSVFMRPEARFKAALKVGLLGRRMLLLNSTSESPTGVGYPVGEGPLHMTAYRAARDMWMLDDDRMRTLRKYGIYNQRLDQFHASAKKALDEAEEALSRKVYSTFIGSAHKAWAYEVRAYPDVNNTSQDVVKGIIFYMAMLLPFAFFTERLIFDFADIRKQLAAAGGIFLFVALLIRFVHPAFDITLTPFLILLSFVTLALSLIVTSLIANRFQDEIARLRRLATGIHTADVGRLSATKAAFGLGISNMRRRKGRTLLTCVTLVLLMFTVLSFTSVRPSLRDNEIRLPAAPAYEGLLLRTESWAPLEQPALDLLANEFGQAATLAPRAWYVSRRIGESTFVEVRRGDAAYDASALVGMTAQEAEVSGIDGLLRAGSWLSGADRECILPAAMADALGIADDDVGNATVSMFGMDFTVRGIFAPGALDAFADLDGESVTPVKYQKLRTAAEERQITEGGWQIPQTMIRRYDHMPSRAVAIVPYGTAVALGADTRSVAIHFRDAEQLRGAISDLSRRLGLTIFAGVGGTAYQYSSVTSTTLRGDPVLLIPLLIAALIVLNTMLGAVYERTGEIGIYSSVGLAPVHVAALFIAESCVYAVIGAIAGYLVGQGVAKLVVGLNLLPGLTLNYSSLSAVFSTIVVMAVVIGSTLYPAAKASSMAVPDVHRRWELSQPAGDDWTIDLPFTFSSGQEIGVNAFLHEFFSNHTEDVGMDDFYSEDSVLTCEEGESGRIIRLRQDVWLAPFDLGISQTAELVTSPMDDDIYTVQLHLHRLSGDVSSWKRMNRRFLNTLRKQYLIWRTLAPEAQEEFCARGMATLQAQQ